MAVTLDAVLQGFFHSFPCDPGEGKRNIWNATKDQRVPGTYAVPSPAHDWDLPAAAATAAPALAPEAVSMGVFAVTSAVRMMGKGEREERDTEGFCAMVYRDKVLNQGLSTPSILLWKNPFQQYGTAC